MFTAPNRTFFEMSHNVALEINNRTIFHLSAPYRTHILQKQHLLSNFIPLHPTLSHLIPLHPTCASEPDLIRAAAVSSMHVTYGVSRDVMLREPICHVVASLLANTATYNC